jgi:hypothetical protein
MNDLMSAMRPAKSVCVALLLLCSALWAQNQQAHGIRNIVLVHGAWADGSGWKRVYVTLVKDGYKVEVAGVSHVVYISRPKEVAALIEQAASQAR